LANIGEKILSLRKGLGLNQSDLANMLNKKYDGLVLDSSVISKYEKGLRKVPVDLLIGFAESLQTTPNHLLGFETDQLVDAQSEKIRKLEQELAVLREFRDNIKEMMKNSSGKT